MLRHSFVGLFSGTSQHQIHDDEIIPFLGQVPATGDPGQVGVCQQYGLAAEAALLHIKCFVFVHFYNRYRREGDLQHLLEAQFISEEAQIYCLSIDICLAKRQSDLTDDKTKKFWIDQVCKGQVLGVGGGPSCETWSAARHLPGGPKPV